MEMKQSLDALHSYEFDALLEALRRDLRIQLDLAKAGGSWAQWHTSNARTNLRLLEALNPKAGTNCRRAPAQFLNPSIRMRRILKHEPV